MRLFADTPSRGLPPSSTAAPAAAASAPTHATGTSGTGRRGRLGSFGSVVHKERVEVEAVGQYPRPDGIAADREGAVRDRVLPPHGNLGLAQVGVHCGIDPDDGPVDDSAVLELDGHGLPVQLLQKLDQLHGVFPFVLERASRTEFLGGLRSYHSQSFLRHSNRPEISASAARSKNVLRFPILQLESVVFAQSEYYFRQLSLLLS